MISFNCSQCGKNFSVKPEFAGRKTKCPKCGTHLIVPRVTTSAPSKEATAATDWNWDALSSPDDEGGGHKRRPNRPSASYFLLFAGFLFAVSAIALAFAANGFFKSPQADVSPRADNAEVPKKAEKPPLPRVEKIPEKSTSPEGEQPKEIKKGPKADPETQPEKQSKEKAKEEPKPAQKDGAETPAQKKAAAWVADLKAKLAVAQDAAKKAKENAQQARRKADQLQDQAEAALEQANKDNRILSGARLASKYYQEYWKEDKQAARSEEVAKQLAKEFRNAGQAAREAEQASRQADVAVIDAEAAVRQAEAVYYSLAK